MRCKECENLISSMAVNRGRAVFITVLLQERSANQKEKYLV